MIICPVVVRKEYTKDLVSNILHILYKKLFMKQISVYIFIFGSNTFWHSLFKKNYLQIKTELNKYSLFSLIDNLFCFLFFINVSMSVIVLTSSLFLIFLLICFCVYNIIFSTILLRILFRILHFMSDCEIIFNYGVL